MKYTSIENKVKDITIQFSDVFDLNKVNETLKRCIEENYRYYAEYYFNDTFGSMLSNDSEFRVICYGNNIDMMKEFLTESGYKKAKDIFDGGYTLKYVKNGKILEE